MAFLERGHLYRHVPSSDKTIGVILNFWRPIRCSCAQVRAGVVSSWQTLKNFRTCLLDTHTQKEKNRTDVLGSTHKRMCFSISGVSLSLPSSSSSSQQQPLNQSVKEGRPHPRNRHDLHCISTYILFESEKRKKSSGSFWKSISVIFFKYPSFK